MVDAKGIPLIFSDGVANFTNSIEIVKFYLYRFDPGNQDITGSEDPKIAGAAQVVMPVSAALESVAFLMKAIDNICVNNPEMTRRWEKAKAETQVASNKSGQKTK